MNNGLFVIYGATGDLAKRKLIPALFSLYADKKIEAWRFIGASIDEITTEELLERVLPFCVNQDASLWSQFKQAWHYKKLDFSNKHDYQELSLLIETIEKQYHLSGKRLVYVAAASTFYTIITTLSTQTHIIQKKNSPELWHRIVFEKPFGFNYQSAKEINRSLEALLQEDQIYRVDHFLSKELVSNIALIRFTNCVFEPLWNNRYIDQVQIILNESIGIEGRGRYYDQYGALSDVVQNHMLELLALTGMEAPEKLSGNYIRNARQQVLSQVSVVDGILGQYQGYQQEEWVNPNSQTETFAMLYLRVNNPRWAGVPFYLKTGKRLQSKETVIHIKFKQVDCLLLRNCPVSSNWLSITISSHASAHTQGSETSFSLSLNAKKPGVTDELIPIAMEFCHSCYFGQQAEGGYELLIQDILRGDQTVGVGVAEIEFAWKIIDQVRALHFPVYTYKQESEGPDQLNIFEKKHGMRWRS